MFRFFPLLLIVLIIYNVVVFGHGMASNADIGALLAHGASIRMVSGDTWTFSVGDIFILGSLILLFVEIIKATRANSRQIVNHGLSLLTFAAALIEFITLKGFATSVFFFLVVMTLFDVVAGYTISIVAAEHDIGLGHDH